MAPRRTVHGLSTITITVFLLVICIIAVPMLMLYITNKQTSPILTDVIELDMVSFHFNVTRNIEKEYYIGKLLSSKYKDAVVSLEVMLFVQEFVVDDTRDWPFWPQEPAPDAVRIPVYGFINVTNGYMVHEVLINASTSQGALIGIDEDEDHWPNVNLVMAECEDIAPTAYMRLKGVPGNGTYYFGPCYMSRAREVIKRAITQHKPASAYALICWAFTNRKITHYTLDIAISITIARGNEAYMIIVPFHLEVMIS